MTSTVSPSERWQNITVAISKEFSCLPESERQWIEQQIAHIHQLQRQLHALFVQAQGLKHCQSCLGSCCERGNNHMTLANVLSGLLDRTLPAADFSQTCPFLTDQGCALSVESRPFNCVTFICDTIEECLSDEDQKRFYTFERQLREHYTAFDQRYVGSSLQGLLIRSQSMPGSQYLAHRL
jgi:hypothetical protein